LSVVFFKRVASSSLKPKNPARVRTSYPDCLENFSAQSLRLYGKFLPERINETPRPRRGQI
jgi:hypothetical protein